MKGVKPKWIDLARRMQALARQQRSGGIGKIEVSVIVDSDGNPIIWEEPRLTKFEPCHEGRRIIYGLLSE